MSLFATSDFARDVAFRRYEAVSNCMGLLRFFDSQQPPNINLQNKRESTHLEIKGTPQPAFDFGNRDSVQLRPPRCKSARKLVLR